MELFRIIKADARKAMGSFGGRAVSSALIIAMVYIGISLTQSVLLYIFCGPESLYDDLYSLAKTAPAVLGVSGAMALVYLFIIPALSLGYTKLHLAFAEGKDESIGLLFDMFSSGKKFFGAVYFSISEWIRYIFVFAVAAIPGAGLFYLAENYIPENTRTLGILKIAAIIIAFGLLVLCVFLCFIFVQRWSLARYYYIEGKGAQKAFSLSAKATKGIRFGILSFRCSFLGWMLFSLLVLPMIYSVPYYSLSCAIYFRYLMERYERSLAETPEIIIEEEISTAE